MATAFEGVFALPSQVLADSRSSRGRDRRVLKRLQLLHEGVVPETCSPVQRRRKQHDEQRALARAIHREMCAGNLGKAARRLDAEPLAAPTPEVMAALEQLHPAAPAPTIPPTQAPPALITADILRNVLRRVPRNSAAGPSGWTYEHVRAAVNGSEAAFDSLLRFVQYAVGGKLPHLPALMASRLVPLQKRQGGVRPIAVGEVLLRLAALCATAACHEVGPGLAPLQLGVGVPGGAQCVGQALRAGILSHPGDVTIQLDWKNAFNSVSRQVMIDTVAARAPALLPFAAWAYREPAALWVRDAPPSSPLIMSRAGVRQGDPCGPLLFALTLQATLEHVQDAHPEVGVIAFADDTFLQGPAPAAAAAFRHLCRLGADIGLEVQEHKCSVFSPEHASAAGVAQALEPATTVCPQGWFRCGRVSPGRCRVCSGTCQWGG